MRVVKPNNKRDIHKYSILALIILWSVPTFSIGMSDIKADDTEFDLSAGEFTAKGNVKIDSDEVKLSADQVNAKVKGTQLLSITATGKPLKLELEIDDDEGETQTILASAHELKFDNEANWVEFTGEVLLQTDAAKIRAQKVRIELDSQKIIATKGESDEQVEITLQDVETP